MNAAYQPANGLNGAHSEQRRPSADKDVNVSQTDTLKVFYCLYNDVPSTVYITVDSKYKQLKQPFTYRFACLQEYKIRIDH